MNKLIIALGVISALISACTALPTLDEIDFVISEIEYCQSIHEWYIENQYHREYTGSVEWHARWVDSYNKTLNILYSYRRVIIILNGLGTPNDGTADHPRSPMVLVRVDYLLLR